MKPISLILVGVLAEVATAFPGMGRSLRREAGLLPRNPAVSATTSSSAATGTYPAWHPAKAGEVRSPCPGLNAAANHNICPRSGKGYTIPILTKCLAKAMNIGADFTLVIATAGIISNPNPALLYFDLDMLDRHNFVIEHDASLSRGDATFGDNHSFNETIWDTVLAYYSGMSDTSIPVAGKARYNRITTELARDPNFSYSPLQFILSYGETALYLSTMGDPTSGVAPIDFVRSLFEEEKLPYDLGWTPPTEPTTLLSLGQMILELNAATGEEVPEGLILGSKSLQAAFIGLNATTGEVTNTALYALAKLTGAVSSLTSKAGSLLV